MTLGTTKTVDRYDGDNSTTVFNVTFEFHAASDLEVIVVTEATGAESPKSLGGDYSVSGGDGGTGQVTMSVAPTTAERLVIRRGSEKVQPDDLIDGNALAAEPLERRLDIITARLQELETDIARALKVAKGSEATGLDLNLVGAMGASLQVATDEQGITPATGTVPANVSTSPFGETWVGLADAPAGRSNLGLTDAAVTALGTAGATIPLLNGDNAYSGTATFSADATFNSDLIVGAPFILESETLAIDTNGLLTPTKSNVLVNTFSSAAADNLDNIAVTNHPVGAIIELRAATAGQVLTLRHAQGGGNIYLAGNANVALDDRDKTLLLQRRSGGEHGAGWYEVSRSEHIPATAVLPHVIDNTTIVSPVGVHDVFWDNADGWLWIEISAHTIHPTADAALDMFLSTDGVTFEGGVTDYAWKSNASRVGSGPLGSPATSSIRLSGDALIEATTAISVFEIKIPLPGDAASFSPVKLSGVFWDSQGTYFTMDGGGFRLTSQQVNGYRLQFAGQNIAGAKILTIGYK